MTTELKNILDETEKLHRNFEEFKKTVDQETAQKVKGYVDPLLTALQEKLNAAITKSEEAIDAAEKAQALAQARRGLEADMEKNAGNKEHMEYRAAFLNFVRKGEERLDEKEKNILRNPPKSILGAKSLNSADDSGGGYIVMPEMDKQITRVLNETSPVRTVATVKTISSDEYNRLQRVDRAGARWSDRDVAPTETTAPGFKKLSIKAWGLEAEPRLTQDLLDDAYLDIEAELMSAVVEEFSLTENTSFISGDGIGQPRGILDYTSGTSWNQIEQIVTGSAAALTADGLANLVYALKDGYLARAKFLMKRSTVADVRKLKDGNGQYLWTPGFGSEPALLMGYPVVRCADMPATGADALCMAFGDFSMGYYIVDRLGMTILRDPFTAKPYIKYYTRKRLGGGVNNFEAIKLHKCHT